MYQTLSFDPESNGDTNAPNGIDPAFFQDQVAIFLRLTQILLKSWHSFERLCTGWVPTFNLWRRQNMDDRTGSTNRCLSDCKIVSFLSKTVLRDTQRAELKSENAGSLTTHHMIILWSLSQILSRAPEMLKLPFRFPDWGQLVGVERPELPFPCESEPVFLSLTHLGFK